MLKREGAVVMLTTALSWLVIAAYGGLHAGWRVSPAAVLVAGVAATAMTGWAVRPRGTARGSGVVLAIAIGVFAALVAMAWPSMLPVGGGPDLTHHLVLINHLERGWRLVDDPALYPYLGDMMDYTPGSHLLIALAGAWSRTDGIHAAHTMFALTVALKAALIVCIAARVLPDDSATVTWAATAALLLFFPYQYFVGSFAVHSYWAQVVAELFAIGAWWALVAWDDEPDFVMVGLFGLFGVATFIAWPVWIGPLALTATAVIGLRRSIDLRRKVLALSLALAPVAVVAAIHTIGRTGRLQMAATSGYAIRPSLAVFGTGFLIVALAGLAWLLYDRRGRVITLFLAATAIQALALFVVARAESADTPYLALKMMYLTPYPLAVGGAVALAFAACGWPQRRDDGERRIGSPALAWIAVGLLTLAAGYRFVATPRPVPIVTASTLAAGQWAHDHVDRACVDYLVAEGYTGYWLHLAVLDNPRDTPRFNRPDTFEPAKAVERWIETDGLPYAIVDDVNGFSKALFSGTDTLAEFGPARVIKRRGRAICER